MFSLKNLKGIYVSKLSKYSITPIYLTYYHILLKSNGRSVGVRTFSLPPTQGLPKKKAEYGKKAPVSYKTLLITTGISGALLAFMLYVRKEKEAAIQRERSRALGKAAITGKFSLINHNGIRVTDENFRGKWLLVYFGFTNCPDICPDEIEKLVKVIDNLDKTDSAYKVQPLFITVDPERDSVDAVAKYVKEFSPKLIGLTGSKEDVAEACRNFRVYFSAGPRDQDNDYIVDHTIIVYLINPEGDFVDYYGQNKSAENITSGVLVNMSKFDQTRSIW